MVNEPDLAPAADLLCSSVASPFVWLDDVIPAHEAGRVFAVEEWYRKVWLSAPLWCFHEGMFRELRGDTSPTSYPLPTIAARIAQDEEAEDEGLDELARHVKARRETLSDSKSGQTWISRDDGQLRLNTPAGTVGSYWDDDAFGYGDELMSHVEAARAAHTKADREEAARSLDSFLEEVGLRRDVGRPTKAPPPSILAPLFEQGHWLFRVCWAALPDAEPSAETREILGELGVSDEDATTWAIRLALPMLSACEIAGMREEISKPLGRRAPHTPPRRFTVFALEHRLGIDAVTLARDLRPREDARSYFPETPNPIQC